MKNAAIHITVSCVLAVMAGNPLYGQVIQNTFPDTCAGNDTIPRPVPETGNLAPGTLKAAAEIINLDSSGTAYILKIKILNIMFYGAAAPPLTPGRELSVRIPSSAITWDHGMDAGSRKVFILQHIRQMEASETAPDWEVVEIVTDNITPDN